MILNPNDYPLFSKTYATQVDAVLSTLMLEGSTTRLMFGALIGSLTGPMLLPAMWLVSQCFKDSEKWYAISVYWIFLTGAVLSPIAHVGFFYVGEMYKAIYSTNPHSHHYLLNTGKTFVQMLNITWGTAVSFLAIGWISFTVCIFLKKTILPKWMLFMTPIALIIIIGPIGNILPLPYSGWINGAIFNISYSVFFFILLMFFRKKIIMIEDKN